MITFILGEDRHVKYFVHSIGKYEYFAVKEAQFSLIYNGEEEISGECEIEKDEEKHGYYIDVKIQPAQKSKLYVLEITLKIADEIILMKSGKIEKVGTSEEILNGEILSKECCKVKKC